MDHATSNINGKIWLFWNTDIICTVLETDEQQITCEISHTDIQGTYIKTFVYAKCKDYLRRPLWDRLLHISDSRDTIPWCTVGDFNVIIDIDEKLGGIPYNMRKSVEFIGVIEACGLMDLGFNGPKFTWSNQRGVNFRIWKRLDRAMVNDKWLQNMPHTSITHLPSVGSDHCPLLLEMKARPHNCIKYFRFLNFWVEQPSFIETVNACWNRPVEGNPMWTFHQKIKRLASTLRAWSKMQFGDIYVKVKEFEERVKVAEDNLLQSNTEKHREELHGINAEYIRYMKLEDSILKQKSQLQWFKEGDSNSKYFHALIRGRRRRLFIHKILNDDDEWIQGDEHIAQAACTHFQHIFSGEEKIVDEIPMNCIPRMVSQEHKDRLKELPTIDELKEVVHSMNPNSAAGPDGMNGCFFQKCWNIIKNDLMAVILAFFSGQMIPKYFSHACLVLLPKVKNPNRLNEFRPISLSNFTTKIISKLLCIRLTPILPTLISPNQSGFVKDRSISENIMLAQEIIHQIKKPTIGSNVVIKLDMEKAYDRVSWSYICLILRKMGFKEIFIDIIWRIMANNWYSIILNGRRYGFFQSTRGLKQGDPLSPALFISGAEVLSRSLNRLHQHPLYHGFYMEMRGPQINHLSFADDIIIFTSGRKDSLKLIMQTLATYERISGQLINKAKSHFLLHPNAFKTTCDRIKRYTGFHQKEAPITYLGCPLFIERPKLTYFSDLINKIVNRITGWQSKMLSYGGKATLIKHVLQSMPIDILSAISPLSTTLKKIQSIGSLAQFTTTSHRFDNETIADFTTNGQWNVDKLNQFAPQNHLHKILSTTLQLQHTSSDQAVWNLNANGLFTISSAWDIIREKRTKTKFNSYTWNRNIPFKCSFLLWRTIRGKIPTNEKLVSFGIEPSECYCCHSPGADTIDHIFNSGNLANNVWKFFAIPLGIPTDFLPLRSMIMRWWSIPHHNEAHKSILQATPIFICWNLWKNQCAKKYGGKQSNIARVKHLVILDTFKLLHTVFPYISWPLNWSSLCKLLENCIHNSKVTAVQWIKPPEKWVKLNTDGSALNNPGSIGAGGVLRNHMGELLLAFSVPLGEGTNNQAEVEAALFGLTWCAQLNYNKVILEVDSQLLVDYFLNKQISPWSISSQMQRLQQLSSNFPQIKCIHTLREANFVADTLSKHSHQLTSPMIYFNTQQLPKTAAAYLQQDMAGMASFRRRKLKRIKEPP
ncbi:uncharacterized protein LOC125813528 [Solanum verrucosum]|uniref:uncharacterized protein LOC125813528 n=1 Tax=Solanum verrucosum TaxID=315347 RepID=UPI0020CFFEAC|nr:uncharacterized protein LOC125813528 [Solanum verrucosum]